MNVKIKAYVHYHEWILGDCSFIAKNKNVNELFNKSDNFKLPGEAETSSSGEQLVRNIRVDGNENGAENLPAPSQIHFLSNP